MKVLYPYTSSGAQLKVDADMRRNKGAYLDQFKADGFYLIDACDSSVAGSSSAKKQAELKRCLDLLIGKINKLISADTKIDTKIILITNTVYKVCYAELKSNQGFNVINTGAIPFPLGHQVDFRAKMKALIG
jgi:hypothetical protein